MSKKVLRSLFAAGLVVVFLLVPLCVHANEGGGGGEPLRLHYYYMPSCPNCEPANRAVREAEAKYGDRIHVTWHNLGEGGNIALDYFSRLTAVGMEDETPKLAVFFGGGVVYDEGILHHLQGRIEEVLALEEDARVTEEVVALTREEQIRQAQQRSSWVIVILAGLGDGVNPCAFATVILFVSMLTAIGRSRREILAVGGSFILAVFLTYFAIGLLFYYVRGLMIHLEFVSLLIDVVAFLFVLLVGVLSLYDAVKALRTGGRGEMVLVLPESLKDRIRKRLRVSAHSRSLIVGSFITGIIISFLEAACTGQIYFPLVNILVTSGEGFAEGMLKLLGYNLAFILPLMVVFVSVFFGASSETVAKAARRRVWLTKLLLALVFLGMGTWLGFSVIPRIWKRVAPESTVSVRHDASEAIRESSTEPETSVGAEASIDP